ncbi:hypothetical protein Gogos_020290 [Gossypium gossypioides]|uniref:Cupin type-1 domain-containing protein n=1 Tax=Gossypium gossypioides TaxID=34282 RepID=A0A7J9D191_GOSGO|nr:hypothetical protein [Gossypium gossypioides]
MALTIKQQFFLAVLVLAFPLSEINGDLDITSDFVVPFGVNVTLLDRNFFTYTGMRPLITSYPPTNFIVTKATMAEFPAFNGQSVSYIVLQYPAGSVNPFHTHPRATELLFLTYGILEVRFVDTTNKLFTQRLQVGDIFVFPKGLVHYQFNCAENDSVIMVSTFVPPGVNVRGCFMANSQDSMFVDRSTPSFSSSRLIQVFPRHDTVKLDEKNFTQCQEHIRLITEGHEMQGFLDGTLPAPPRFVASPDGTLTSNPDAATFLQQDKLLPSWLLSTINVSLLSSFTAAKTACDIWTIANRLFAASTGAKISRIKHELYSLKKGILPPLVQNTCALLETSGSVVSEAEKVEVIFAGLPSNFDAVLTLASFSLETLSFQRLVNVPLEFESRQTYTVQDVPMHANLAEASPIVAVAESALRPGLAMVISLEGASIGSTATTVVRVSPLRRGFISVTLVKSCLVILPMMDLVGPQIAYCPCVQSHNGRDYGSNLGRVFGYGMECSFGLSFGRDMQREFRRNLGQQQFESTARVPRPPVSS